MINDEQFKSEIDKALFHFKNQNYLKSIQILEVLKNKRDHFLTFWYLGHSFFRIHNYNSAVNCIKKSIELKKPDHLNLNFLAEIYHKINRHDESIKLFKEALALDKKNLVTLFNLANIYLELGKLNLGEKYLIEVINSEPTNFRAWYELIQINDKYLTNDLVKKVETFVNQASDNNLNYIYSKLIIAENFKRNKNYSAELENLLDAHNIYSDIKDKAGRQEFNYFTNLLPKFISKIKIDNLQLNCDLKPIFIMGLPRSGTTLVEYIISSAPNVIPAGETEVLSKVFFSEKIIPDYNAKDLVTNFKFKKDDFEKLKILILNQYSQLGIDNSNNYFTDKSLENILYIELIQKVFPKAKFVYCKRNKQANFLGILKVFLPNLLWTHSPKKIIEMMNLYEKKIKKLINDKKIKIKIIELENLSENPEKISKDLFDFLEINWRDDLGFIDNKNNEKKIIKTRSNLQVRNQISKHDLSYLEYYLPLLNKFEIEKLN